MTLFFSLQLQMMKRKKTEKKYCQLMKILKLFFFRQNFYPKSFSNNEKDILEGKIELAKKHRKIYQ